MKTKNLHKKSQQMGSMLMVIALITSIFALGLCAGSEKEQKITGAVSGMENG